MQREALRPAQQRAIIDRKALAERLDDIVKRDGLPKARVAIVAELQQALTLGRAEIANRLRTHPSKGYRAAQEQAFLVDQLVRLIYDYVVQHLFPISNPTASEKIAILAVGGGSSIDCAKVIAFRKYNDGDMTKWAGMGNGPDEAAPLFVIPTTSGTGSEATMGAVITNQASHKKEIIGGEAIHPKAVALDACLMVGLPKPITAATGIDALTHGIEAYISTWERGNRTEMGRISVQGVFRWLRMACEEPGNMDAREGMALAAYNAGVAINQVNVGNVHAIAHQLGANFGIPHGHANALVLPHVLTLYGDTAVDRLAELAVATGISDSGHPETRARAFIAEVEKLIADVGIAPTDPRIKRDKFDVIAEAAMDEGDGYFCPRQLEKSEILNLLEAISE